MHPFVQAALDSPAVAKAPVIDRRDRRWTDSEDGARIARNVCTSLRGVLGDIHGHRFAQARRALSFEVMRIEVYGVPARLADPTIEIARRIQSHLGARYPLTHVAQIELEALIDFWAKRARLEDGRPVTPGTGPVAGEERWKFRGNP